MNTRSRACTWRPASSTSCGSEFEGDFTVNYHLAPPLLAVASSTRAGRPRKRAFGPWIQTPMKVLARLKMLRGTPLDVFGYTAERRSERALDRVVRGTDREDPCQARRRSTSATF